MRPLFAVLAGAAALAIGAGALAQPQIPATFYGSVTIDGRPAASGVEVRGLVNGVDCTQAAPGTRPVIRDGETAAYVLHVMHESQREGCARDGAFVTFTIAGVRAVQQATWRPGPIRLDLSTGAASPIPLPSPTGTIAAAITAAGDATQQPGTPTSPRPTGAVPTDDVDVPGITGSRTPSPPAIGEDEQFLSGDDSGRPVWALVLLGVLSLGSGGGILGYMLYRRRNATATPGPPA